MTLEEMSGDKYPDLHTVQQIVKCSIVAYLAETISDLLDQGVLVIKDGKVMPNSEKKITEKELL
jgi:hypothetical protein